MAYVKEFTYQEHADNTKKAKAVEQKWNLTRPQIELLRRAARPWSDSTRQTPHDGKVPTYGVMQKTCDALQSAGFIGQEYKESKGRRIQLEAEARQLIVEAKAILADGDPFREVDEMEAWKAALVDLGAARTRQQQCQTKVTRITAKGREVVVEFLAALGIVEE